MLGSCCVFVGERVLVCFLRLRGIPHYARYGVSGHSLGRTTELGWAHCVDARRNAARISNDVVGLMKGWCGTLECFLSFFFVFVRTLMQEVLFASGQTFFFLIFRLFTDI